MIAENNIPSSFRKQGGEALGGDCPVTEKPVLQANTPLQAQNRCFKLHNYVYFLKHPLESKIFTNPLFNFMQFNIKTYPNLK